MSPDAGIPVLCMAMKDIMVGLDPSGGWIVWMYSVL